MNLTYTDDHVAQGLARLLEQFKDRPLIGALFTAFLQRQQGVEDALYPLNTALEIDVAVGAQLDILGQIVGASRNGLSDDQYRAFLLGTVAQNNGDGSLAALVAVIKGVFLTDQVFIKTPNGYHRGSQVSPAVISIAVQNPGIPTEVIPVALASVQAAVGAGVAVNYVGSFVSEAFAFAGDQPWVRGFGVGGLGSLLSNKPAI